MKESSKRHLHYYFKGSPTPDDPGYDEAMAKTQRRIDGDPGFKKRMESMRKKAFSIAYTQSLNGLGFIQDDEIRYFQDEFNSRLWEYGFASMPSSFRVLEGFFKWRSDLFMFEIFEEVEHLFSLFDFIDFITSEKCTNSIEYFLDNVEDDLIHSYNILNEIEEITFKTSDSVEYVIGGVSVLKRGNEAYLLLIAGEKNDIDQINKEITELGEGMLGKSYIKPNETREKGAVTLLGKKDIWKVNLYLRIDLLTKTIDLRYIQKDQGDGFQTITDDLGMLKNSLHNSEELSEFMSNHVKEVEKYEAIFEVAYKCLHLPEYFNYFDANIKEEEHPTKLFPETLQKSPLKKVSFNHSYFMKTRTVWVLDNNISGMSNEIILQNTELKVEKSGYWKQLPPGQIGVDKNGSPIHNRSWIEQTLTWYETETPKNVHVNIPGGISQNSGYIYIMRNASHALDIFKIGLTTKTAEERAGQLSATTGAVDKFLVIQRWKVHDCFLAEKLIHNALDKYRVNPKREFFKIEIEEAFPIISSIIKEINGKTQ